MDFVLYVLNMTATTDFDDFAEIERETVVERDVYWHDGVEIDVRKGIKFDEVNHTRLAIKNETVYGKAQSISVRNSVSNEMNSFSNSATFRDWLYSVSMEELPNYVFEVCCTSDKGKTTIKYFVEKANFEEPTEHKKAKLYRFEGFDRSTNEVIRKLTFSMVGCDKGLTKVKRVLSDDNYTIKNCIIMLNGIDISDYFDNNTLVYVLTRKSGAEEYAGSRFRVEYAGVQQKITILENACEMAKIWHENKPDELKETLTRLNNEIEKYRKMLASNQRIHGGF